MQYGIQMIKAIGSMDKEERPQDAIFKILMNGNFVLEISDEFTLLIGTLINGGMRRLVMDMGDLKYIDSTGIGIFINLTKQIRTKGGDLVFVNVNSKILEVFGLVKLQDFIPCFKSEKQMMEHLSSLNA